MATGGVSVIIRARDEAAALTRCLSSLEGQRGLDEPAELIVVDGGSRDGTVAVARRHGARIIAVAPGPYSFGGALNLGAAEAHGAVLVALSAHALPPDESWLARLSAPLAADPRVACACGDAYGPDGEPLTVPIDQDEALARRRPEWGYSNAAGGFRAELWRERGFRADLGACEDKEWALHWLARGYVCHVDPSLRVAHDHTHDPLRAIYRRAHREAAAYADFLGPCRSTGAALLREWWSDRRWYDSAARARLSPRRTARLLGAHAGRRA
ncbi:MAG TPA: glycosyltransferase, partial [Solirubrobacteraceae bacterium]|nr:glycosyltransferase [Solirubrobacteraceae bacterium]